MLTTPTCGLDNLSPFLFVNHFGTKIQQTQRMSYLSVKSLGVWQSDPWGAVGELLRKAWIFGPDSDIYKNVIHLSLKMIWLTKWILRER